MWCSLTCGVHVGCSRKKAKEGMLVFRLPSLLKWKLFCFLLRTPVKNFWDLYEKLSAGRWRWRTSREPHPLSRSAGSCGRKRCMGKKEFFSPLVYVGRRRERCDFSGMEGVSSLLLYKPYFFLYAAAAKVCF